MSPVASSNRSLAPSRTSCLITTSAFINSFRSVRVLEPDEFAGYDSRPEVCFGRDKIRLIQVCFHTNRTSQKAETCHWLNQQHVSAFDKYGLFTLSFPVSFCNSRRIVFLHRNLAFLRIYFVQHLLVGIVVRVESRRRPARQTAKSFFSRFTR